MILQAARDLNLDLPKAILIGDQISDIEAAAAAGIQLRIWLKSIENCGQAAAPAYLPAGSHTEALKILQGLRPASRQSSI